MKREKTTALLSSSTSSSSSYRERAAAAATHAATPDARGCLHSKSIGCMSGLFHLLSRYQHRRKSLTYGKRQQKNAVVSPPAKDGAPAALVPALLRKGAAGNRDDGPPAAAKRISCEVPRSPTLPAEIRRSHPRRAAPPLPPPLPAQPRPQQPTVVARLMGLTAGEAPESAAEKRRELLGALDKCDRDLKALKKIIDVVRSSEQLRSPVGAAKPNASFDARLQELAAKEDGDTDRDGDDDDDDSSGDNENGNGGGEPQEKEEEQQEQQQPAEQPSPVSVLEEFTRSTLLSGYAKRQSIERLVPPPQKKKPLEEFNYSICLLDRITYEPSLARARIDESRVPAAASPPPSWISEAMRQSVEQVCKDIAWGQRREVGRIGLALHDHICRDLIEEMVREMGYGGIASSLPFEACKRRLRL
ncbi:transmembrane protein 131 isoform X2 [Eucalyptus grandis]|uniref:transmembrane protein 131 isoform X2 n=1 Tax=Eucalyptus grandis TaxID=71139 RepID=UPI00192E8E1D|nr:transmembrane protein 131 isoform X2 [Eucalyptus grandis]